MAPVSKVEFERESELEGAVYARKIAMERGVRFRPPSQVAPEANAKNLSKYPERAAFLISDKTWQDVMSLVPLAIWTEGGEGITRYPLLIYHEEEAGRYDLDAILDFVRQYGAETVVYSGDLPEGAADLLTAEGVTLQPLGDYSLSYWTTLHYVVVVEDNLGPALMASAYASLINAPLIIEAHNDDLDLTNPKINIFL